MNELHRPLYAPDLLVNALNQDARRPLLEVPGGERLTVGDMRDSTSQYVQALAALGLGKGSRIGLLSSNRPEVLVVANAIQVTAAAYVPLHPMAGVSDHLYVVSDANIDVLIFDAKYYGERAQALLDQIPGLQLLAFGSSPIAQDLIKVASRFVPAELVAPRVSENDILRLGYSG